MRRELVRYLAILLFSAASALAQTTAGPPPLEIRSGVTAQAMFAYTVTNVSGKDVKAFTVSIEAVDRRGQRLCSRSKTLIRGLGPGTAEVYKAGEVVHQDFRRIFAGVSDVGAWDGKLDYVLFADGSHWGPDNLKTSIEIAGMFHGRFAALDALKRMLSQQGPDAVITYLKGSGQ